MIPGVTTLNYLAATFLKKKKLSAIDRKATHGCHRVRLATSIFTGEQQVSATFLSLSSRLD